jgi:hypothetical protein
MTFLPFKPENGTICQKRAELLFEVTKKNLTFSKFCYQNLENILNK